MKAGEVYKQFTSKSGKLVTLRSIRWEDLPACLQLINQTLDEKDKDPDLGVTVYKEQTLESEADWLGKKLASVELGQQVSVVATVDGKLVGNSEVSRGSSTDEFYHGKLGLVISKEYRNQGIGLQMVKTLVEQSRQAGLKTIELEVFASNSRAIHVYELAGFKEVGRIPKKIFRNNRFTDIVIMSIEL